MFADTARLPFDVGPLRALPYRLGADGRLADAKGLRAALTTQLQNAQVASQVNPTVDSPLFQLLDGYPNIAHERTDIFRETVEYSRQAKDKLAFARSIDLDAVRKAEGELGPLKNLEAGVVIDLFLSYRSQRGWSDMIRMAGEMPRELAETILVQEQLGLALNREGRHDEAERIILALVDRRGPSSETFGILGRIYKDQWEKIRYGSSGILARGMLDKAIGAYLRGFEADWRDAYPGINAVTLMEVRDPPDPRRVKLTPIVRYAVERKIASGKADYWDHATLLELAVLAKDDASAASTAGDALAAVREKWEPETTARNLRLIREGRAQRNESVPWADEIEAELNRRSAT
jgi:hypothetical protein